MNRYETVARSLREAQPHGLMAVLRGALSEDYAAVSAELFLADYGLKVLCHVPDPPGECAGEYSVFNSVVGRVFGAQETFVEDSFGSEAVTVHLPVSARGDRLGVLTVELKAADYSAGVLAELGQVASLLGHEILVAERDTDVYRTLRRRDRLTLAAEVQWDLLPGRGFECPEYSIGAQLEPAYSIRGDNFDWSAAPDRLTLGITNGMGEGIDASLLTSLAVNALRNARRSGIPLADQVALADKAVYAHYRGERYLDVLLLGFDLATGEVQAVDAGSPLLYRLRGDRVEQLPFEAQLPMGMAEDTVYTAERFRVEPGDRLVFVSDGVFDAKGPSEEETFGSRALSLAILATRLVPSASVPQEVLRHLAEYRGEHESVDDALVVCLDWRGRSEPE
ncbi:Phosphoserine phosphatase rsbU [Nocardiopsis dassonvillei]|uniref:Protein serine/threonine phosphatase n=2 Tax=Nocardiopsis dassonvillei TaxID=2014 RepID=D7B6H0_NOCDD|nr:protein serine/threonine phosphatase [Nocardiopsis dassonvillei subsp. dassonvillei DSM 43111]VEI89766.1 Phosphoserine phosphatase rsbU [Nocardiopsis dassonvillei]